MFAYIYSSAGVGSVVIAIVLIVFNVELPAELRAFIFYVQVRPYLGCSTAMYST